MPTFQDTQNTSDGYVHTKYEGSKQEIDEKAIEDIKEYLGSVSREGCSLFQDFVKLAEIVESRQGKSTVQSLNMQFSMAGVTGRPFHAFCRRYCLQAYREWMGGGSDPIETDERGFRLAEGS